MTTKTPRAGRRAIAAPPREDASNVVDISKAASARGNATNRDALEVVKNKLAGTGDDIEVSKRFGPQEQAAEPGKSNSMPEDPWSAMAAEGKIVEAPFDLLTLAMLPEHSSELGQCIDAMVANIDLLGHRQISRVKLDDPSIPVEDAVRKEVLAERAWLANFFEYCTQESFSEFRERLRKDLEATGNGYFEVIRDLKGQIQQFQHIPSYQMRLTKMDDEAVECERSILKLMPDGSVVLDKVKEWRRFRRYCQGRALARRSGFQSVGTKRRWFKSFGDPRDINRDNGESGTEAKPVPADKRASEVVHLAIYCPRSPYGMPRFIGNLLSIYGDRAAEEINYTTFRNNNIPSMMILVSGGQLTDGSIKRLESFVESQIQGSDNRSKFVIVEAEADSEEGEDAGQLRLTVERMTKDQHNDALFQQYSKNNQDKIRRAFRLPPLLVGRADDYTRTTAETSRKLADEQVFSPERDKFDALFNRIIYPVMGVRYHKFKSNTPNTTDNESLVKILSGSEKTGGMTPRIARAMLEDILSKDLPEFPPDFPADVPFSLTMAEAVKNQADPAEPGQQITALKVLKALLGDGVADELLLDGEDAAVRLLKSLGDAEAEWQREVVKPSPAPEAKA
jgi:PBSX family phage portal protein